jgi:hypothetical protein
VGKSRHIYIYTHTSVHWFTDVLVTKAKGDIIENTVVNPHTRGQIKAHIYIYIPVFTDVLVTKAKVCSLTWVDEGNLEYIESNGTLFNPEKVRNLVTSKIRIILC